MQNLEHVGLSVQKLRRGPKF